MQSGRQSWRNDTDSRTEYLITMTTLFMHRCSGTGRKVRSVEQVASDDCAKRVSLPGSGMHGFPVETSC
jgi:hypothetical protein